MALCVAEPVVRFQGGDAGEPEDIPEEYARLQQAEERAEGPAGSLLLYNYDGKCSFPFLCVPLGFSSKF